MQDKSIKDTAIITITIIGGLFLLQKCTSDEVKKDIKIEKISQKDTLKEHSQKDLLIDDSYNHRDKEIALASYKSTFNTQQNDITHNIYIEKNNSNINTIKIVVSSSKDTNKTKDKNKTIQTSIPKVVSIIDKKITLLKSVNATKSIDIPNSLNVTKSIDMPKSVNATKSVDITNINKNINKAIKSKIKDIDINISNALTTIPKAITIDKIKVPKVETTLPKVPKVVKTLDIEKVELKRSVKEREKELKLAQLKINQLKDKNKNLSIEIKKNNQHINQLEDKINSVLYNNDNLKDEINKLKKELKFNQERREKALNQKVKLESQLAIALEKNKKLEINLNNEKDNKQAFLSKLKAKSENQINGLKLNLNKEKEEENKLKEKITKILNELKIKETKLQDFNKLSSEYKKLEANLTSELKSKEFLLAEKVDLTNQIKLAKINLKNQKSQYEERIKKLKETIVKMLTVAKEDSIKARMEYNSSVQEIQAKHEQLEQNLSIELERELSIISEKAELEDKIKSLEQNITTQIDDKSQLLNRINKLKATVVKMLTIAKEKSQEASVEYNKTIQNFTSIQKSLEQNLSAELEKEKLLANEKAKLEDKIKSLEQNVTTQIDEKSQLSNRIDKLKATVVKMLTIAKEKSQEASVEYNKTVQHFTSIQKSLEQNLSAEIEKKKLLADEKVTLEDNIKLLEQNITTQIDEKSQLSNKIDKLKATVAKMLTIAKEKSQEALVEYNKTIQHFTSKQKSLEQNLSVELGKEKLLADEKAKLEDKIKLLEQNITTQIDEKGQLSNRIDKLKATVVKMLTIAKEKGQEASVEYNKTIQNFTSKQKSLEQNLSSELEKEKLLADEKAKLEDKIKSLEQNLTTQIDKKAQLLSKINELKATVTKTSENAKEETKKIEEEYKAKFQALLSQKESIEQNLSTEL
ncbi:MAG: hypothetical protein KAU90_10515, partial [Sulfurovaceae bacterium]|nr:hypothetical protein [Sulfurovaceae bacterium]